MIPVESQIIAQVMFWYSAIIIVCAIGAGVICYIFDRMEAQEEQEE